MPDGAGIDHANTLDWHISRSWPGTGTPCEDECPCPQEACGHVAQSNVRGDCSQHGIQAAKTLRSTHAPEDCPGCLTDAAPIAAGDA